MRFQQPVIGLETHIELKTKSKMFCGCPADHFGAIPNSQTCPVCLGLPGALPVPNQKAINWTIMVGLALGCQINSTSKFDRKHYFYPDLPKGYQISQYDEPLCINGLVSLSSGTVRITRVHLEEDTGKLQHAQLKGNKVTLVDFNRSGVPLVEIVSEPDITSAAQAKEYAQFIRQLVSYLQISNADMEKGSLRLEANISWGLDLGYKVEVKNINSFRFLEKAIDYELDRQSKLLSQNITPKNETRGFDEKKLLTVPQRAKETAADYRYFPEPDIPPLKITTEMVNKLRRNIPRLPQDYIYLFTKTYNVRPDYAIVLAEYPKLAAKSLEAFEIGQKQAVSPQIIANFLINQKALAKTMSATQIVANILQSSSGRNLSLTELDPLVRQVLANNPDLITKYRQGKTAVVGVFIGQIMKSARGHADPQLVEKLLIEKLKGTI